MVLSSTKKICFLKSPKNPHFSTMDCLYIYIYIYFIEHNRHFLSTYFLLILSYCRIDFIIFGRNWLINLP